jgi:hypothetical protein
VSVTWGGSYSQRRPRLRRATAATAALRRAWLPVGWLARRKISRGNEAGSLAPTRPPFPRVLVPLAACPDAALRAGSEGSHRAALDALERLWRTGQPDLSQTADHS